MTRVYNSWRGWKVGYRELLFNLAVETKKTKIDV